MAVRRDYEAYWNDIESNFARKSAIGGETAKLKAMPKVEAERHLQLSERLVEIDREIDDLRLQKKLAMAGAARAKLVDQERCRLSELVQEEARVKARVAWAAEDAGVAGIRPGFRKPYHEERSDRFDRAAYKGRPGAPLALVPSVRNRELGERWGQNPIAGGGYTMKLDAMKYAVLEKEARLQVLEAERDACGDRRLIRVNQGPQHKYIHRNCQGDMKTRRNVHLPYSSCNSEGVAECLRRGDFKC